MKKNIEDCSGEQGVALLLTLGIVTLLMMFALSFALTARLEKEAASVNADMIKARLLAESGLERALGYLYHGIQEDLYPGSLGSTSGMFAQWQDHWQIASTGEGDDEGLERAMSIYLGFDYTPDDALPPNASWHHIKNGADDLVGRLAFFVIDESGKLDPNLATWSRELSEWVSANPALSAEDHPHYYNNRHFDRYNDIDYSYTFSPFDIVSFRPSANSINHWFSWFHLLRGGLPSADAEDLSLKHFPWSYAKETFRKFTPPQAWDDGIDTNRFNLQRDNWSSVPLATVRNAIPWIGRIVSTDGTDNSDIRNQVAANLIAYSSAADMQPPTDLELEEELWSEPAWDGSRADWPAVGLNGYEGWPVDSGEQEPAITYLGCKNVPYVNELAVDVSIDLVGGAYIMEMDVTPEMIHIYEDGEEECELTVLLQFQGLPSDAVAPTPSGRIHGASIDGAALHWDNITVANNSYQEGAHVTFQFNDIDPTGTNGSDPFLDINNFSIRAFAVVRDSTGEIAWDGADMGTSSDQTLTVVGAQDLYINFSASDPRANTLESHWQRDTDDSASNHTLGSINDGVDVSAGDDLETVVDPIDGIASAYVRNAPMELLWELGAIHRGEPWQTLNLTAFNDREDLTSDPATWDNGDAAILDQVRLTNRNESYYRVNVNTSSEEVWRSLFEAVSIESPSYEEPWDDSLSLNVDDGSWVAERVTEIVTMTEGGPFINRGEIARIGNMSNGDLGDVQREREEVIGKIAHLLTTRQNYFRIVVTAQAVLDMPDAPGELADRERNVVDYGSGLCRILAEQKIMAIVYRDAFENTYQILRYEYLDE